MSIHQIYVARCRRNHIRRPPRHRHRYSRRHLWVVRDLSCCDLTPSIGRSELKCLLVFFSHLIRPLPEFHHCLALKTTYALRGPIIHA